MGYTYTSCFCMDTLLITGYNHKTKHHDSKRWSSRHDLKDKIHMKWVDEYGRYKKQM